MIVKIIYWVITVFHSLKLGKSHTQSHLTYTEAVRGNSLVVQMVKNPPAMRETWVWSLGWEDPLEKGKAAHSSILAWRIPWTVWSVGVTKSRTWLSDFHFHYCYSHFCFYLLIGWPYHTACRISILWPEIRLGPLVVKTESKPPDQQGIPYSCFYRWGNWA